MFYSQFILAKKGPLGTIWIAAHLERKLRKNQVADTDIGVSVDSILFPEVPIALRLSSHLLLGVVRIYSRKVNYLFDDCSEALLKIKQAFRSAAVDLPPEQSKAPYHSITLPETFDLDDFELPDNELFQGNFVDHHVSAREQITLQDTMDGAAFPTSQFGPDERFGDGDASQIGLDLDEELFLDKGEAAGTSGTLMDIDADPQASVKASSPLQGDGNDEGISDPPISSPANYFNIQAPSTPGLMEEPNLPSAQEALVSDDHMDEDHNPLEVAGQEVPGNASSQSELPNFGSVEFHANDGCQLLNEQETEEAKSPRAELSNEAVELISSGNAQPDNFSEHVEAANGLDNVGNILNGSCIDNERSLAAGSKTKGTCEDDVGINGIAKSPSEETSVMNEHTSDPSAGSDRADLNGTCTLISEGKSENDMSLASVGVPGTGECDRIVVSSGAEPQNAHQSNLDATTPESSNIDVRLSVPSGPVLQACTSHIDHACNGVSSLVGASDLPTEDGGHFSLETSEREDANIVCGVSAEVEDNINKDGKLDNMIARENSLEKEHDSGMSDLPALEKLLSMPDLPVEQASNFLVECTPGKEHLMEADGDATMEKIISGRKRSYTESTLTIQSLNSAESSGATQSKRSVEFVLPEDDDLLSSILVGRKSPALKLKSTPPVSHPPPSKRQRIAVRSSAHKRKVLIDDATVLHGDTIRQQLTDTEDIRRVRKKAPCTRQEVWMLQKQILEDEIFCEPVFTGMALELVSLHSETFDLSRIRIIQDDQSKEANEMGASTRPACGEETECVGSLPSVAGGDQECGERLVENPSQLGSTVAIDGSIIQKETETLENEVTKETSQDHTSDERVEKEIGNGRVPLDGKALGLDLASLLGPVSVVNGNAMDDMIKDSASITKAGDVIVPGNIDVPEQSLDQVGDVQVEPTRGDASTFEGPCGAEVRDQVVNESGELGCERSDGKHPSQEIKVETTVVREDIRDCCSSPAHDISVTVNHSMPLEDGACLTSDQFMEEGQLNGVGIANTDEILAADQRDDAGHLTPDYHTGEELKLDSSYMTEADFSSRNSILTDGETLGYCEGDPKIFMESTPVCTDYADASGHADFGTDAIEHDTDFLNVDDDEIAEDYEGDMPSTEEKRILDNSRWSARTRAVANYLQVLFEKQGQHGKKDISLESLLAGKSRKEASRMFFETLVLKTKDYIQAEQENAFCDIRIKPRGKLLESEF